MGGFSITSQLRSMEVWLAGRLLLAPREADLPLLQASLTADVAGGGYDLQVTWAQIALVYRQCDFEHIMDLCSQELTLSKPQTSVTTETMEVKQTDEDVGSRRSWRYRFNIDAPLLFLPASGAFPDLPNPSIGGLSDAKGSRTRTFQALHHEGYAILDLGNCLVQSNPSSRGVQISMTRLQVFFAAPEEDERPSQWHQIIRPVTAEVELQSTTESFDIRVLAPLEKMDSPENVSLKKGPLPAITLTRAHATQFFDVLYLNLSYSSSDEVPWHGAAFHLSSQKL